MIVDFSKIDFTEKPVLVLRNADGTAIQVLGYAYNLNAEIRYNETSTITFDLPAMVDGVKTPHYDDVIGMRIIDMVGWGQFILVNPTIKNDGVKEIKSCKAYSLEYELTYKKMSLEESTYNFYNPVSNDNTILGIILSYLPSWELGEVDEDLIGKYRTFSEENVNIYNFIKSTVQETYGCIFDFDTYGRKIHVKATSSPTSSSPIYISLDNLAKEIELEEDTENIFTVLDVNGAEGVSIRNVNPLGTNKIYNLDYYMNDVNFSDEMLKKWNSWKTTYEANKDVYYNLTTQRALISSKLLHKQNEMNELKVIELAKLESQQAVEIEALAELTTASNDYSDHEKKLADINDDIKEVNEKITRVQGEIDNIQNEKASVDEAIKNVVDETKFSAFFNTEEEKILDRYFKEDAISESSFVVGNAQSYSDSDNFNSFGKGSYVITSEEITKSDEETAEGDVYKTFYSIRGGTISFSAEGANEPAISADIVRGTVEYDPNGSIVFSLYLNKGRIKNTSFESGTLTMTSGGSEGSSGNDVVFKSNKLTLTCEDSTQYFTRNATEYEQHSVEMDLYEYGVDCLNKLAYPSYSFKVDTANFFALAEFYEFAKKTTLGEKVYLSLGDDRVLEPILIGVDIDFENIDKMELLFGDTFNLSEGTFSLVDLLDQSISMGKTVDTSRFNYNSFIDSGASTAVKEFMDSSLDVSKNAILSSTGMAVSWDASGIKCRKATDEGGYEPEQIAIINNSVVFTDNNWQTAKMAIGHFQDKNSGETWGIVAPNIVGTLLAGENLVIESPKVNGDKSVFRVDGSGAFLYNAQFDIVKDNMQIALNPDFGIVIGETDGLYTTDDDDNKTIDINKAMFWADDDGNLHLKGTLEACDGNFSGDVQAKDFIGPDGKSMLVGNQTEDDDEDDDEDDGYKFDAKYLSLYGLEIMDEYDNVTLEIDEGGNITMNGAIYAGGSINGSSINGSDIIGAKFWDKGERAYMTLGANNSNYADLCLYRNGDSSSDSLAFRIRDEGVGIRLQFGQSGESFLSSNGDTTTMYGDWTLDGDPLATQDWVWQILRDNGIIA